MLPADDGHDFISRYFAPANGVPEDPATGAAHCMLAPYLMKQLGKTAFRAWQVSRRGGESVCRLAGDRVELEGSCVFCIEDEVEIGGRPPDPVTEGPLGSCRARWRAKL